MSRVGAGSCHGFQSSVTLLLLRPDRYGPVQSTFLHFKQQADLRSDG